MKPPCTRKSALTSVALLTAAACGYLVGTHSTSQDDVVRLAPSRGVSIKRVTASPGARVEVRHGTVFVNGEAQK